MIYKVTLNPSIDYIASVENFSAGRINRTNKEIIFPGGKGINVSIVLKNLGLDSTALGFVSGFTGKELINQVSNLGIENKFLEVKDGITRINVKLRSNEETEINGMGPTISNEELNAFYWGLCSGSASAFSDNLATKSDVVKLLNEIGRDF